MPKSQQPGFDPSILRHSVIWGEADEAVVNNLHIKRKNQKKNFKKKERDNFENGMPRNHGERVKMGFVVVSFWLFRQEWIEMNGLGQ
jgi:hypothetical protein